MGIKGASAVRRLGHNSVRLFAVLAAVTMFAGCGGSGDSGEGGRNGMLIFTYFHWSCNGDSACLAESGRKASGTLTFDDIDTTADDIACQDQYDHAYLFWGAAAGYSCDIDPNGAPGAPIPAVILPSITGLSQSPGGVMIEGDHFPTDGRLAVAFGTTQFGPDADILVQSNGVSVRFPAGTQDATAKLTVYVHGGRVTSAATFTFMNDLLTVGHGAFSVVYVAGRNDTLRMSTDAVTWNYLPAFSFANLEGPTADITGIAVSPSRQALLASKGSGFLSSVDWVDFTILDAVPPIVQPVNGATWSDGKFLLFSSGGEVASSADGINWTKSPARTTESIESMVWSGSRFAVCGSHGLLMISSDGYGWIVEHGPAGFQGHLHGITWGNGLFVAVGAPDSASTPAAILTSPDGVTWTAQAAGTTQNLTGVAFSGTLFAAVGWGGTIVTSPDGVNWTTVTGAATNGDDLNAVTYVNGQFIAVGASGTILTSGDGSTWTRVSGY